MLDQLSPGSRAATLLVLALLVTGIVGAGAPAAVHAFQEANGPAAPEEAATGNAVPGGAASADVAPPPENAAPVPGGAAAPGPAAEADADPVPQSFLSWMIEASGLIGAAILLTSILMVAVIVMNILEVRRENLLPQSFIEAFEAKLQSKDYQAAYEIARADDSFVARVLAAGLSKLNRGYSEAVEGMQEVGEEETMEMEHRLSYLALIGSIAPMLGLLGTVYGMIESFSVIANSSTQPKPSELADGIATALFTTFEGLVVAIPAIIAYNILRNRMNRYVLEVGMVSEGLMSRFSSLGKSGKSGTAPPAT